MPMDRSRYPDDWEEISHRIRFERAGNKCEWCGAPNRIYIRRAKGDHAKWIPDYAWKQLPPHKQRFWSKAVMITLTVAHIDHDTTNNDDSNLAALCNRCHLMHDAEHHAANAKATRARKAREAQANAGQLEIWDGD